MFSSFFAINKRAEVLHPALDPLDNKFSLISLADPVARFISAGPSPLDLESSLLSSLAFCFSLC